MIILFGIVGSGKGEQASRLQKRLKCSYISTSQLLREHLTDERRQTMMAGKLVNDDDIFSLLGPALQKAHVDNQESILDGAPRSVGQAKWLDAKIKNNEVKLTAIIYLKVSKQVVLDRLHHRHREDDQDEIIEERFREYDRVTTPALDYLRQAGYKIDEINGEQSLDQVEQDIQKALGI